MKLREIIKIIKEDEWYIVAQKGSHIQFKHSIKSRGVTIAGNPGDAIAPGTLNSVSKQAGLKRSKNK